MEPDGDAPHRPFSVIRLHASGVFSRRDLFDLCGAVSSSLRTADKVMPLGGGEVAVLLPGIVGAQLDAIAGRLREDLLAEGVGPVLLGCASVLRGGWAAWHESWRMAGALLVADGQVPAAA
jgi:hypothetical protein